jgi:4-amino-4-deoxy-L-arabinose transferase-like glycosyltransferase
MLLALWYLTNQLFNRYAALLAVLFALASPALSMIFNARAMMGDIPGVFFMLMGLIFWVHPKGKTWLELVLAGVFFGLACITKLQFALLVMPCIAAGWILNLIWYRQHKWYYYFIPGLVGCIVSGLWFVYVIVILPDPANATQNIAAFRSAGSLALTFDLRSIRYGLNYLASIDAYSGIVIAGLIAGLVFSIGRNKESQDKSQVFLLIVLNFGMYLLSVVEWKRYGIPGLALIPIFLAALVYRLGVYAFNKPLDWRSLFAGRINNDDLVVWTVRVVVVALVLNLTVFPLVGQVLTVKSDGGNQDTFAVATYLKSNAKPDALVETYEPELATVSNFKFHFPLQVSETTLFRKLYRERTSGDNVYNFHDYVDPDYVIVGRLGVWANFYPPERLSGYEVAQKIGDYTIWKKVST